MLLVRFLSFLLSLLLFLFLYVPVGLLLGIVGGVAVFVGFTNSTLRYTLEHRDNILSTLYIKKTVKKTLSKNTIDI